MKTDKCKECEIRLDFARLFDEHWYGKEDCPYRDKCKKEDNVNAGSAAQSAAGIRR